MERQEALETTLGDLVAALTEEAAPYVHDDNDVYKVVAFMLTHLLNRSGTASRSWQYWQ